ncbi:MAG: hypothetical protein KatS3mg085_611 [Candidatus Dojkabacteria bacterium]|nr:MAG: hypothetical protein KatS3mg085_611 [Candidatus Dojkabacteria bacterium]
MTSFEKIYNKLNKEQKDAVDTLQGPVLVIAGPGTGKTQMLAVRIANILKKTDSLPENILCLTFTESGVRAMRDRLIDFIGKSAYRVSIHTFHSFCNEIIQKHPEYFDIANAIQIDDLNRYKIFEDIIEEIKNENINSKIYKYARNNLGVLIREIQNLKKEGLGPEELKTKINDLVIELKASDSFQKGTQKSKKELEKLERSLELAEVYAKYQEILKDRGLYDYEDMINFVIDAFERNEDLLMQYQEQYLYINVDEYQDTNGSQNKLLELLGSYDRSPNIFVVGDDDQAIYRFQGANVENIYKFFKHFENVQTFVTVQNYRSTQTILNAADSLISNNKKRLTNELTHISKKLKSNTNFTEKPIDVIEFDSEELEYVFVAKEILRLNQEEKTPFSEIAVIYKKHEYANELSRILDKFEIPVSVKSTSNVWDNEYIQKLIKILKALTLFDDFEDQFIYEILEFDFININPVLVYKLANFIKKEKISFLEFFTDENYQKTIESLITEEFLSDLQKARNVISSLIKFNEKKFNLNFVKLIEEIINDFKIVQFLYERADLTSLKALSRFMDLISLNIKLNKDFDIQTFLRDLEIIENTSLQSPNIDFEDNNNSVTLTTAHSSKGLQFKYVFIIRSTEQGWIRKKADSSLIPKEILLDFDNSIIDPDNKIEDDRRLFYVAMTRAKAHIYITYSTTYNGINGIEENIPVRFIDEIDEKFLNKQKMKNFEVKSDDYLKILSPTKINFTEQQKEYIKSKVDNLTISSSALNLFISDPIEYLKQEILDFPQVPNKHLAMGSAIHKALEFFNLSAKKGNLITLDDFLKTFELTLYKNFYGFSDYEVVLNEGLNNLEMYYKEELQNVPFEDIAGVEYDFSSHNVYLDIKNHKPVKLTGRIDLIIFTNKNSNEVKIIDYKNSNPKSLNEITGQTKKRDESVLRQLAFYKLATDIDNYFRVEKNLSKPKFEVLTTEIRYLKPNKYSKSNKFVKRQVEIEHSYVVNLKKIIEEVVTRIKNLEFQEEYKPISLVTGERI